MAATVSEFFRFTIHGCRVFKKIKMCWQSVIAYIMNVPTVKHSRTHRQLLWHGEMNMWPTISTSLYTWPNTPAYELCASSRFVRIVSANKEESCSLTEFKAFSLVAQNSLSTRGPGKGSLLMNDDGSQSNASCKRCKIQVMIKNTWCSNA